MSGSGRWSQQITFRNCGNSSCLQGCALNKEAKPHGPYAVLRRRSPETGEQEHVYLGKAPLTGEQLTLVNQKFSGPGVPEKGQIFDLVGRMEKPASKGPAGLSKAKARSTV
jgi:hypothetical protein